MARAGTIRVAVDSPRRNATDPVLAAELGAQLCEIFGLSAERTRAITITLEAGMIATVVADQFVTVGQAQAITEVASTYGLHRAPANRELAAGFTIRNTTP